jgi:hypothetical protein
MEEVGIEYRLKKAKQTCRTIWDDKNNNCMKGSNTFCEAIIKYSPIWNKATQSCEGSNDVCKNIDVKKPLWNSKLKTCEEGTNSVCAKIDINKPAYKSSTNTCEACATINPNKPFFYPPTNNCENGSNKVCQFYNVRKPIWNNEEKTCNYGIASMKPQKIIAMDYTRFKNHSPGERDCNILYGSVPSCGNCCRDVHCIGGLNVAISGMPSTATAACENWKCVDKIVRQHCPAANCPQAPGIVVPGTDNKCCRDVDCIGGAAGASFCRNNKCVDPNIKDTLPGTRAISDSCNSQKDCIGGSIDPKTTDCIEGYCRYMYKLPDKGIAEKCENSSECDGYFFGSTECKEAEPYTLGENDKPEKVCQSKHIPPTQNRSEPCGITKQCANGLSCRDYNPNNIGATNGDYRCYKILNIGEKGCKSEFWSTCKNNSKCEFDTCVDNSSVNTGFTKRGG